MGERQSGALGQIGVIGQLWDGVAEIHERARDENLRSGLLSSWSGSRFGLDRATFLGVSGNVSY
jgi:hypothetical protein